MGVGGCRYLTCAHTNTYLACSVHVCGSGHVLLDPQDRKHERVEHSHHYREIEKPHTCLIKFKKKMMIKIEREHKDTAASRDLLVPAGWTAAH